MIGLEHKAFTGPFSQEFPDATVWIQPGQWSFPFNLPPSQLGFPSEAGRVKEIPLKASDGVSNIYMYPDNPRTMLAHTSHRHPLTHTPFNTYPLTYTLIHTPLDTEYLLMHPSHPPLILSPAAPWFKDFDHCVLEKLSFKSVGGFGETAFFHRSTGMGVPYLTLT